MDGRCVGVQSMAVRSRGVCEGAPRMSVVVVLVVVVVEARDGIGVVVAVDVGRRPSSRMFVASAGCFTG